MMTGSWRAGTLAAVLATSAAIVAVAPPATEVARAEPTTLTFTAVQDTFVSESSPSSNFGAADYFDVYGGRNPTCVPFAAPAFGLLRFNLNALPEDAEIASARVVLTSRNGYAQDGDPEHHLLLLDDDGWDEDVVTWDDRPDDGTATLLPDADELAGDPLAADGESDIRETDRALGSAFVYRADCGGPGPNVAHSFPVDATGQYKHPAQAEADLIAAIQGRRADDRPLSLQVFAANNCTVDCGASNKAYWVRYWSSEAADPSVRPRLEITLAGPVTPQAPTPVLDAAVSVGYQTLISGSLDAPAGGYTIEVWTGACDAEAFESDDEVPADTFVINVDGGGPSSFTEGVSAEDPLPPGTGVALVATGTDDNPLDPSGFSNCLDVTVPANSVPVLVQAVPSGDTTLVAGRLSAAPFADYEITVRSSSICEDGFLGGEPAELGSFLVTTDADGNVAFSEEVGATGLLYVDAVASEPEGDPSDPSRCIAVGPDNDTWTRAQLIPLSGSDPRTGSATGRLDTPGGARWYKVAIEPGAKLTVRLGDLPADYDLAVFKDIDQAFTDLLTPKELTRLSAEFAPSVFSPSVFSPSVFSPSVFSPDAYAPSVFSPSVFSPSVFSPSVFSPSVFSPSVFSPSVFSPSVFSPSVFSPSVFSPSVFSADAPVPEVVGLEAFANAQTRSLIAVSATAGTGDEVVIADTWNNTGFFYLRVTGRNGAFDPANPFTVSAELDGNLCANVAPISGTPTATDGDFRSIIVWDSSRFDATLPGNSVSERLVMGAHLVQLAAHPEVEGVIVDVAGDGRIDALNAQADAQTACPYAKNLVAWAIKDVVDAHRDVNPDLEYVVLVGNDAVIPFFRYPDQSLLGPESQYEPPVHPSSASEASLRLNYIQSQDEYGASVVLSQRDGDFPVPDLAVGRLVESAAEITGMIDAYLDLDNGVVPTPESAFVTGYDFLEDAADEVSFHLGAGLGPDVEVNELITPNNLSPADELSWTADDLRREFLGQRHDLTFLAGHFSANSALAADFETSMITTELVASDVDLKNAIVFSTGCHSGYTIVDGDIVPGLTLPLDWTQAFAQKQATLIAGTGYQYGDTDFLEYSERIYGDFARELRTGDGPDGTGPVSVGQALVRAKQHYLSTTPDVRGLHRKSVLIITVYGLPMLGVDMPGERLERTSESSIATNVSNAATQPGFSLGLRIADVTPPIGSTLNTVKLTDIEGGDDLDAEYLKGSDGVVTNPAEPALPLEVDNVSVEGGVLRGVGFRGGAYSDTPGVLPLTGAPATEIRGVHTPFTSPVWFPMRLATVNYFDALGGGETRLLVTPAQHRAEAGGIYSTRRDYNSLDLRLYYSDNLDRAALAAAPTITDVTYAADDGDLLVGATVYGDPAAGIQEVWVTYTGHAKEWKPLDLDQCNAEPTLPVGCDTVDSTRWVGRVTGIPDPQAIEFIVQAANGVGLVSVDDNFGAYYGLGSVAAGPGQDALAATLTLGTVASSGEFGDSVTVSATLTTELGPEEGRPVSLGIGGVTRLATTDGDGLASASIPLATAPGGTTVVASFAGDAEVGAASASAPFRIDPAPTRLSIVQAATDLDDDVTDLGVSLTLLDTRDGSLPHRSVLVTLTGPVTRTVSAITNHLGRASLAPLSAPLPPGPYTVSASFAGERSYLPAAATGDPLAVVAIAALTFGSFGLSGAFGDSVTVSATLSTADGPVSGREVTLGIGGVTGVATTDDDGVATAEIPLDIDPGLTTVVASFAGEAFVRPATVSADFTVVKASTELSIEQDAPEFDGLITHPGVSVKLVDSRGGSLGGKTVLVVLNGPVNRTVEVVTDGDGLAALAPLDLPYGTYSVSASFAGDVRYEPASATGDPVTVAAQARLAALVAQLRLLAAGADARDAKRINDAIKAIESAFARSSWTGPLSLDRNGGGKVFDDLSIAARKLAEVTNPPPGVVAARGVVADVARQLAVLAVAEARAVGGTPRRITEAEQNLARGATELAAGRFDKAIDRYGDAWKKAQDAIARR